MQTLSFGIVDERAVFMDERTDTYFTLDPASEQHLHALLEQGEPLSRDSHLLDALGVANGPVELIQAGYAPPSRSLLEQECRHRPRLRDVIKVAGLVRSTRSRLQKQPIETVLLAIAKHDSTVEVDRRQTIFQTGRYLSARRLVPVARNCLLDSLSLLRWLGPNPHGLTLIFGVKLEPFAAHCWVQADDLVINDRTDIVASFTPVRVIQCSEATP